MYPQLLPRQLPAIVTVVGYVVAAWVSDLDVANGILPGYVMGLFFFTGYPLRLQVRAHTPLRPATFASLARPLKLACWRRAHLVHVTRCGTSSG